MRQYAIIALPVTLCMPLWGMFYYLFIYKFPKKPIWWARTDYVWYSIAILGLVFAGFDLNKTSVAEQKGDLEKEVLILGEGLDSTVRERFRECELDERRIRDFEEWKTRRRYGIIIPEGSDPVDPLDPFAGGVKGYTIYDKNACENIRFVRTVIDAARTQRTWPMRPARIRPFFVGDFYSDFGESSYSWLDVVEDAPGGIHHIAEGVFLALGVHCCKVSGQRN